jgi:hypothetical protein
VNYKNQNALSLSSGNIISYGRTHRSWECANERPFQSQIKIGEPGAFINYGKQKPYYYD